jgi:hypothetical protein
MFEELSASGLKSGWTTSVAGASQGGGNALAVHKMIDSDSSLSERWRFSHSYCAAGPYNPELTVEMYLEAGKTDHPVLFPLTLRGMKESFPEILGGFDEALFYSDSYLPHKEEIEQMIDSKEYTTAAINARMVNLLRDRDNSSLTYKEVAVADILSDEMMDPSSVLNMALMECLRMNDLTAGWTPSHPARLYYSEADKVVPYENSIAVYDAFGAGKVKLEKGLSMDHGTACALWMLEVLSSALP